MGVKPARLRAEAAARLSGTAFKSTRITARLCTKKAQCSGVLPVRPNGKRMKQVSKYVVEFKRLAKDDPGTNQGTGRTDFIPGVDICGELEELLNHVDVAV